MNKKVLLALIIGTITLNGCGNKEDDIAKILDEMVTQDNMRLPVMLDSETRFERVERVVENLGVNYIYTIVNYRSNEINLDDYQQLKPAVLSDVCSRKQDIAFLVEHNVQLNYLYYTNDNRLALSVSIQPATECPN